MAGLLPLLEHVPFVLLVAARLAGVMLAAPVLSSIVIPRRVSTALAFLIAAAVYPSLAANELADGGLVLRLDLLTLAPLIAAEAAIGATIGWMSALPMLAGQLAGQMAGTQLGLGFAQIYDPATDANSEIVGSMLFWISLSAFLVLGGHVWVMLAVLRTFEYVPLGTFTVDGDLLDLVTGLLLAASELGLRVAAPILGLVALESLAMGFMSKTTPQLNILSLGFPLRILAGISILVAGIHVIGDVLMVGIHEMLETIHVWATDGDGILDGAAFRRRG